MFSKDVLYIILNSLVFSKLFYCLTVWSGTSKENIHKLKLVQSFPGRIHTKKFDQITPVLHELGLLTTEELLCLRGVPIIFKCLNGLAPNYLSTKSVKRPETHSHCTRQNLPQCRASAAQCSFRFVVSKYWNSLPNDIRNATSVEVFERCAMLEIIRRRK